MGPTMTLVWRAALAMCIVFAGCLLGILLQHSLPTEHVADAKSAITTIQGLVGLLLALVLGLLVGTSYGVYSQQPAEVHTLGSQILQLDLVLERYGPQADPGRELLKKSLWPRASASGAEAALNRSGRTTASRAPSCVISIGFLRGLRPADDEQRYHLDAARQLSASIGTNALSDVEATQEPHSEGAAR